jgi:hypothetical protein
VFVKSSRGGLPFLATRRIYLNSNDIHLHEFGSFVVNEVLRTQITQIHALN